MNTRVNPVNGEALSALGFGCMRFPTRAGRIDEQAARPLLTRAIAGGVNYLDTAYIYHNGQSEGFVGKVLEEEGLRGRVRLATKLPPYLVRTPADIERIFQTQRKRLRVERIDYYLIHMLQDLDSWKRLCALGIGEWIQGKQRAGEIGSIGFSFHGNAQQFVKILEDYDWQFTQIQYNYLDENTQAGRTGLLAASRRGLPVMVMEPLRGGRLACGLPEEALRAFHQAGGDPVAWALGWLWNQPEVTCVLSGMSAPEQLEQNLALASRAAPGMLTPEQLEVIRQVRRILSQSIRVGCTGCGYCMPCPQGVDIPTCFSAYNEFYTLKSARYKYLQATGMLGRRPANASRCVGCGRCEARCPQHLPIREKLQETARQMERFPYPQMAAIARRFM